MYFRERIVLDSALNRDLLDLVHLFLISAHPGDRTFDNTNGQPMVNHYTARALRVGDVK
jgi:hypothetical protein